MAAGRGRQLARLTAELMAHMANLHRSKEDKPFRASDFLKKSSRKKRRSTKRCDDRALDRWLETYPEAK